MTNFPYMPALDIDLDYGDLFECTSSIWHRIDQMRRDVMSAAEKAEEEFFYRGTMHDDEY